MRRYLAVLACSLIAGVSFATSTPQTLPLTQNWSNAGLITTNDDWSGVPGFVGYLGNIDALAGASVTGMDPQGILGDDDVSSSAIDVIAQAIYNNTTGGVLEDDDATSQVVGLQGSGTADAPFLAAYFVTTGLKDITVAYKLVQVDVDNAIQPMALQYRVGASGGFVNVPSAFVADCSDTTTPGGKVTNISVVLPSAVNNLPVVTVRWITTNAVGSDNIIGIDDISITGAALSAVSDWAMY